MKFGLWMSTFQNIPILKKKLLFGWVKVVRYSFLWIPHDMCYEYGTLIASSMWLSVMSSEVLIWCCSMSPSKTFLVGLPLTKKCFYVGELTLGHQVRVSLQIE